MGRHPGLGFLPLRGLGGAVFIPHDVGAPLLKSGGARSHVFLVVKAFGDPNISDRMRQRRACTRQHGNPLSPQERTGVIEVRINMHHLDPKLPGPLAANSTFECCVGAT